MTEHEHRAERLRQKCGEEIADLADWLDRCDERQRCHIRNVIGVAASTTDEGRAKILRMLRERGAREAPLVHAIFRCARIGMALVSEQAKFPPRDEPDYTTPPAGDQEGGTEELVAGNRTLDDLMTMLVRHLVANPSSMATLPEALEVFRLGPKVAAAGLRTLADEVDSPNTYFLVCCMQLGAQVALEAARATQARDAAGS